MPQPPNPNSRQASNSRPRNLEQAKAIIGKYPEGRQQSALLPLLDLAQRQHDNWLPRAAMDYVADLLEMPPIRAYEVASFYTMYQQGSGRPAFRPGLHHDALLAVRLGAIYCR